MDQVILVIDENSLDQLVKMDVRLEEYAILAIYSASKELLQAYLKGTADQRLVMLQPLVRKELLDLKESDSFSLEDYSIAKKGVEVLTAIGTGAQVVTVGEQGDFDKFIQSYIELFPKGVKNGGNKPLRSNVTDVKTKMIKFMNKYKHTEETILKATERFIEGLRGVHTFCPTSEYFILKDGSSALASECENLKNGGTSDELINPFEKRM